MKSTLPKGCGDAIRNAIKLAGGRAKASELLKRTQQAIGFWYGEPQRLDAVLARRLSALTNYQIPVSAMRPDVFSGLTVRELGYAPAAEPKR